MSFLTTIATHVRGGYRVTLTERNRRITDGLAQRKATERWVGRVPYGYRRPLVELADGRRVLGDHLEPDPETAPIVRRIFGAALAGERLHAIADGLNGRGVPSWTGGHWTRHAVSKLLRNRTYLGRWGAPPLVNPETAAHLTWPRPRRPLEGPTAWSRHVDGLSPEQRAELRATARERARRWRSDRSKTNRTAMEDTER